MADEAKTRIFIYDGKEYPDPDPNMKPEEVRQSMAQFFPELSNAETKEGKKGDAVTYTFTKRVGTKGASVFAIYMNDEDDGGPVAIASTRESAERLIEKAVADRIWQEEKADGHRFPITKDEYAISEEQLDEPITTRGHHLEMRTNGEISINRAAFARAGAYLWSNGFVLDLQIEDENKAISIAKKIGKRLTEGNAWGEEEAFRKILEEEVKP